MRYSVLLILAVSGVFDFGVQAKPLRQLQQRIRRLDPAVIADVAGDAAGESPDLSIQGLDEANEDLQRQDLTPGKFNQSYVPRSPPHGPDVSPGDPHEKIDDVMSKHAEFWRPEPPGMPRKVKGSSCASACAACRLQADEVGGCRCKVNCIKGTDPTKCLKNPVGWSNDDDSKPDEIWEAKCNAGLTDCSECRDEELEKEQDRCLGDPKCLHKLGEAMAKPAPERFCHRTKVFMSSCEVFTHVPTENDWECYHTREECTKRHEMKPYEENFGAINTPCVWCKATNKMDPEPMIIEEA